MLTTTPHHAATAPVASLQPWLASKNVCELALKPMKLIDIIELVLRECFVINNDVLRNNARRHQGWPTRGSATMFFQLSCNLNLFELGCLCPQGMWAHKLSCEAYQDLLDRGWRRSGQWVYRPLPDKEAACRCHPYTIRLDANKFQPSKVQPSRFTGLGKAWDLKSANWS